MKTMMKTIRSKTVISLVVFFAFFIAFISGTIYCITYFHTRQNHIDTLASQSIACAYTSFSSFLSSSDQEDYIFGMSCFYAYMMLFEETSFYNDSFSSILNSSYAKLLYNRNITLDDIESLVIALDELSDDCSDIKGYTSLMVFVQNY